MLRISNVTLRNWRNFNTVNIDLQDRVFLVGPNASGKSNFLDVFRFLADLAADNGGFQDAVRKRGGIPKLRYLAARQYSDVLVEVTLTDESATPSTIWKYEITFNQDRQRNPIIKNEAVVKNGVTLLDRPTDDDKKDEARLRQTDLEQIYANAEFRDIYTFFRSIRYLHIVPQLVRDPDRSVGRKNDPYGGDFLEQIANVQERTRKARLRWITDALKIAIPQLEELELKPDAMGRQHLRGRYQHWRDQGAWLNEEQLSDGTLRLLGLLWSLLDGNGPLLLEEPELSLHPAVIRIFPQMLGRLKGQKRYERQIFLSTHSVELLSDTGIGLNEVLLLMPESEGTAIKSAAQFEQVKHMLDAGFTLGDIITPLTKPQKAEQLAFFPNS
jgi:predicted ATPase